MANQYGITDGEEQVVAQVTDPVADPNLPTADPNTAPVETPAPAPTQDDTDYRAKLADYQRQVDEFRQWKEAVAPELEEAQRSKAQEVLSHVQSMVSKLEEINETAEEPLDPTQLGAIRGLVGDGIRYRAIADNYTKQERAGTALHLAGNFLGATATVKELQSLAKELYELEDPRLMDRQLKILAANREYQSQIDRRTAATQRGPIDTPPAPAPIQASGASDFKVLEAKVANKTATRDEEERFMKLYAQVRRGGQ